MQEFSFRGAKRCYTNSSEIINWFGSNQAFTKEVGSFWNFWCCFSCSFRWGILSAFSRNRYKTQPHSHIRSSPVRLDLPWGLLLGQIFSYWPPHRRRILVHEAGHLLTAYLMGCPIRGVILDPIVAMQMGIQGQAGTQFWDEKLEKELGEGRLSTAAFDRYIIVLFGGIAAEALVYGEAEGGENYENLFKSICVLLQPPLSIAQMSNQARWSVLQSYNLLKWHKSAHRAAVKALERGSSLSVVIRSIEEAILSNR